MTETNVVLSIGMIGDPLMTSPSQMWVSNARLMIYVGFRMAISEQLVILFRTTSFLPARRYASAGNSDRNVSVRLSVCPSICLSRASIVPKRRKLASWFLHHLVAPWFYFSDAKFHHQILRGSSRTGASKKGTVRKFSDFLALSVNISKTVADTAKVTIND